MQIADIAPWIAIVTASLTVLGTVAQFRSGDRIRRTIARDIELHAQLPEGAAKETLGGLLELEAERLDERVRHGRRFSLPQAALILGAVLVLMATALRIVEYSGDQGWLGEASEVPEQDNWASRFYDVSLYAYLGLGAMFIAAGTSIGFAGWLTSRMRPDSKAHFEPALMWVMQPILLMRVPRERRSEMRERLRELRETYREGPPAAG